jgi:predicted RecA/RadA family phage recombinase
MANISQYLQEGLSIDHTPVGAVYAGSIIQVGALSAFAQRDIAAAALGAVQVAGVIRGPYVGGIANVGDNVWWDANGTPYGSGVADGAFTCNGAAGDWWAGTLVKAAVAADTTCDIALNKVNPNLPPWTNKAHVTTAADLTLVGATHNGKVVHVTDDGGHDTAVTLPIGVAGMEYIIQLDEADATMTLHVDLNGNETIEGNLAVAATELAHNTIGTSKRGDFLHLVCETNALLWRCVQKRGTWVSSA